MMTIMMMTMMTMMMMMTMTMTMTMTMMGERRGRMRRMKNYNYFCLCLNNFICLILFLLICNSCEFIPLLTSDKRLEINERFGQGQAAEDPVRGWGNSEEVLGRPRGIRQHPGEDFCPQTHPRGVWRWKTRR